MKKRLLACVLVLSLLLNLSVSAFASDLEDSSTWPIIHIPESYDVSSTPDIEVNPEDYVLNSGVATGSLGLTLSIGHVAALIAAGGGIVYASQYMDDLGVQLTSALNSAAASIPNGTQMLTAWLVSCYQGAIKLKSAPSWISQTINTFLHDLTTGISSLKASYYSSTGYMPPVSGQVVPAGQPVYVSNVSVSGVDGSISRPYYTFDFDVIPFTFVGVSGTKVQILSVVMAAVPYASDIGDGYSHKGTALKWKSFYKTFTCDSNGIQRQYMSLLNASDTLRTTAAQNAFNTYVLPGSIEVPYNWTSSFTPYFEAVLSGAGVSAKEYPDGIPVAPDVLVGGVPDVWIGQGLGHDVITFPDIMVDGTGVLAPDTSIEGDIAIDAAVDSVLDKLATGELTWEDYWLDISQTGSIPTVKVEDTTTGEIVDKPLGGDTGGSDKDPVVVPEYSTDPNEYSIDLKRFFPFCIPFDLYDFLSCLAADPETPKIDFVFPFLDGQVFPIYIDLSPYDDIAQIVRNMELFSFVILLAVVTRDKMIKG